MTGLMMKVPVNIWWMAARPKTLWAGVAPVVVGTALAYGDGAAHWPSAVCALLGSVLLQVGANYANDYFDFVKGADTVERIGPRRVTQSGLVAPDAMKWATVAVLGAALVPGAYLVWRGGWPFVVIGLVSILCAVLYTAGPHPLGYLGLGDVFVLAFFGPVAVGGTYYAQTGAMNLPVWMGGLATGLIAVALLTVNNLRDIEQDRLAGKRTLAVRYGRTFARFEYVGALAVAAIAIPIYLYLYIGNRWFLVTPPGVLIVAAPTIRIVFRTTDGASLNQALAATGRLLLVFSALFSAACVL